MTPSLTPLNDTLSWALFLDIDGTLLDLASRPDDVVVPCDLPPLLDTLTARFSGALALISGRSLEDIDRLFPGGRDAAGSHGAEWRLGGATSAPADVWSCDLARMIEAEASLLPGVLVERKTRSVALHFRAAPQHSAALRTMAETAMRASVRPLRLLEGKMVIELVPAGMTKGGAIKRFMDCQPYTGRKPVFIGDDVTDESGFVAVNEMGGLSIHVGDDPATAARFRFHSPAWLRHWLTGLEQSLGETRP
mgnify:CR=1 FL=1